MGEAQFLLGLEHSGHGHDRVFKPFYWHVKDAPPHPWPEVRVLKDAPEPKPAKKRRRSS